MFQSLLLLHFAIVYIRALAPILSLYFRQNTIHIHSFVV